MWFFWLLIGTDLLVMVIADCCTIAAERDTNTYSDTWDGWRAAWITGICSLMVFALCLLWGFTTLLGSFWWLWYHPWHVGLTMVGYFAIGVLYSVCWLPSFVRDRYRRLNDLRQDYETLDKGHRYKNIEAFIEDRARYGIKTNSDVPEFREYRDFVGRRISWWWIYAINWCCIDFFQGIVRFIKNIGKSIATMLRGVYDKIAQATIARLKSGVSEM